VGVPQTGELGTEQGAVHDSACQWVEASPGSGAAHIEEPDTARDKQEKYASGVNVIQRRGRLFFPMPLSCPFSKQECSSTAGEHTPGSLTTMFQRMLLPP